jgi:hypothetical protein
LEAVDRKKPSGLVRVAFGLDPQASHGSVSERLWAFPVGGRRFRLENSPFFARGVSYLDVVFAEEKAGELWFAGVALRGGHSTYRVRLAEAQKATFELRWKSLQGLGCTYEEGFVLAVDVPPSADLHEVYRLLDQGETEGAWEFEEGHCGHLGDGAAISGDPDGAT